MLGALLFLAVFSAKAASAPKVDGNARAVRDYRAKESDFVMMDRALAGVWKAGKTLYPDARGAVDVIVQDTTDFYIYSVRENYPYEKFARRGRYRVYRLPHEDRPKEHEMWGCRAGPPDAFPPWERRVVAERTIRCAPWGSFRRRQEQTKSNYRFEVGYLATLIHEFGHAYEDMRRMDPDDDMLEIRRRVKEAAEASNLDVASAQAEAYAQWCELRGARALYPAQFRRLMKQARDPREKGEHALGLRVAAELLAARESTSKSR